MASDVDLSRTLLETQELETATEAEDDSQVGMFRLFMLLITAVWGSNFAVMKYAVDALPPGEGSVFTAARFGLAALTLLPPLFAQKPSGAVVKCGAEIGLLVAIGYVCQIAALQLGTAAGKAAFICSLNVLVVAVGSAMAAGRMEMKTLVACGLAISGVGFLELPALDSGFSLGDIVAFGQPITFGLSYMWLEKAMHDHPDDALSLSSLQCLMVFGAALAGASLSSGMTPLELPWQDLIQTGPLQGALLYSAVLATSVTLWAQSIVMKRLSALDVSLILTSEPLFATLCGVLLLHETVGGTDYVGGMLIVAASIVNIMPWKASGEDSQAR
jgi:drug/metabolite transporter (DMT)-like permease